MLKWVKEKLGKGTDDGDDVAFGNDEYVKDFLAGLPTSQPLICLHEIGSVYENLLSWPLQDERRREVVRMLDEFAQRHLRVAWHMLFPKSDEATLNDQSWAALSRYYVAAADACSRLTTIPAVDDERPQITLSANYAMLAMARQNLLLRLRQRPPEGSFWRKLFDLYRRAETGRVAHRKVEEACSLRGSTCGRLFSRILAFEAGPLDTINVSQAHAHFQFVARFDDDLSLGTAPPETHGYCVDLTEAHGPRRPRSDLVIAPSLRFLNVMKLQSRAQSLLRDATRDRAMPDWLSEGEVGLAAYMRLLNHIDKAWSAHPPERRHNRSKVQAEFLVCHGFIQVRRMVAAAEFARQEAKRDETRYMGSELYDPKRFDEVHFGSVSTSHGSSHVRMPQKPRAAVDILGKLETSGDRGQMETWTVEDLSERGFGAVPEMAARWARVGALIAFRQRNVARWNLGVIRRITANSAGRQLLGIEVWRGETAVAKVNVLTDHEADTRHDFDAADELATDAIMLIGTEKTILVPRNRYVAGARSVLHYGGNQTRVQLADATEVGEDYALCALKAWMPGQII
ncbi:MAG: hypothetical protein ACKVQQ_06285 [Burkholderiales bacterium]